LFYKLTLRVSKVAEEIIKRATECLRRYIKDTPEMNKLLGGKYENDPASAELAIWMTLDDCNASPPPIPYTDLKSHPAKSLIIIGAALECLRMAGIWHSRERMPSADGGTSADDHAKVGEYSQWIQSMQNRYEMGKLNVKKSINAASAFGEYFSEYFISGVGYESRGMF
jgi:hypothetical protein